MYNTPKKFTKNNVFYGSRKMNKEYADIEYSKELADMFPRAESWWEIYENNPIYEEENKYYHEKFRRAMFPRTLSTKDSDAYIICTAIYPVITIQMALDVISEEMLIFKRRKDYRVGVPHWKNCKFDDKSLPNALCKMIIYLKKEGLL